MNAQMVILACVLYGLSGVSPSQAQEKQPVDTTIRVDPLSNNLPLPALKTYRALFPDHQIWQLSQTGKGKGSEYELIIFNPKSTTATGKQTENKGAFVTVLANYKLILKGSGEVIQEDMHPIGENAVPKLVKDAVEIWIRPVQGRVTFVEWAAHQEKGADRLYWVRVLLNSVEGNVATLKADGAFVKKSGDFKKDQPKKP
jgi:hypothetical protein